jgi:glycosyltransferase involved in cell wall biosynthesis
MSGKLERLSRREGGVRVVQWAQHPGPMGGVTSSVEDLTAALRAAGHEVRYVPTGSMPDALRALPGLWHRRCLHMFHITRLMRAVVLAPVFAVLPGRTVIILHSGAVRRQIEGHQAWRELLLDLSLRAYDEIWVVNSDIGTALPGHLVERVRVVSPFVVRQVRDASWPAPEAHLVTVATNSGLEHYHAELAVEAVRIVRRDWPDARLWILAYDQVGPELDRLRELVSDLAWVELSLNLSTDEVTAALARSEVFLRPTAWDGDSLMVREALALGTRVVASDVIPRPAGVELSGLSEHELASAVVAPDRVSDGTGVATLTFADAARAALTELSA